MLSLMNMRLQLLTIFCVLVNLIYFGVEEHPANDKFRGRMIVSGTSNPELLGLRLVSTQPALFEECPHLDQVDKAENIYSAVHEAALKYNVDFELLLAMVVVESRCRVQATSHAGAMGLMQLMPGTARWLGVSRPYSARDNILGGGKYISYLLERYNGRIDFALAAYNSGPGNVEKYRSIPPFRETRNYVTKVMKLYDNFRIIADNHVDEFTQAA